MAARRFLWQWSLFAGVFGTLVCAQDLKNVSQSTQVELVPVTQPFFAEYEGGKLVRPITSLDLKILDDNSPPQSILGVRGPNELPLRVGLLIDTSNSQGKSNLYRLASRAALSFLDQITAIPDAKVFVVSFDKTPNVSSFMAHDELATFTPDLVPGGGTALFDAIYTACRYRMVVDPAWPARRVLVILSDGKDNSSHVTFSEALAAASQTRASIFVVDTGEGGPMKDEERRLKLFSEGTGGVAYLQPGGDMTKVFSEIARQIENMYLVTYIPGATAKRAPHHSFKLVPASDKRLRLRSPLAYYTGSKSREVIHPQRGSSTSPHPQR